MTPEQLKASILQRAMEGKLVEQNPDDEPASELLKRIKSEKEKMISLGLSSPERNKYEIILDNNGEYYKQVNNKLVSKIEIPFELPNNWIWVSIGHISFAKGGKRIPKGYSLQDEENEHPYLRVTEMKNGTIIDSKIKYVPESVYELIKKYTISSDDIYITIAGTIGEVGTIPEKYNNSLLTENALKLVLPESINKNFLIYAIQSSVVKSQFNEIFNQVAQPKLSIKSTNSTLIPLPPLKEQGRIVEQIEIALKKVDEYAESYHKLEKLNTEFPEKLKESLVHFALTGGLSKENLGGISADEILDNINKIKNGMLETGNLNKKDLVSSKIYIDNNGQLIKTKDGCSEKIISESFLIPDDWKYIEFRDLVKYTLGKTPPRSESMFWGDDVPWISIADMPRTGHIYKTKEGLTNHAIDMKKINISPVGTLIMSFKLTIGKVAILDLPAAHNEAIISIFPYFDFENIIRDYLMKVLPTISNKGGSKDAIKGKTLNSNSIGDLIIPLPSLLEMRNITNKLNFLYTKIEKLI